MDVLKYWPQYRVLICKRCKRGIRPTNLVRHLRRLHTRDSSTLATERLLREFLHITLPGLLETPLLDPTKEDLKFPSSTCRPFQNLHIEEGLGCNHCPFVSVSEDRLRKHFNDRHAAVRRSHGGLRPSSSSVLRDQLEREHFGDAAPWVPVCLQRFFNTGPGSAAFRVQCEHAERSKHKEDADCLKDQQTGEGDIADQVLSRLALLKHQSTGHGHASSDMPAKSQVSPWLERTRWPSYLTGLSLTDVAQLARPPGAREVVLQELVQAIDGLVEAAYRSVCDDRINYFAQKRIASFLPQRRAYSRPLMVKLQKSTYRRYKETWKRLLCFAVRSNDPAESVRLRHCLDSRQTALLDQMLDLAVRRTDTVEDSNHGGSAPHPPTQRINNIVLDFCISLLDHDLKGDIYESTVIGYLAVLGIDVANSAFYEAVNYTPTLSGFIKIGQMLVLQKAVREESINDSVSAIDLLDEMRERFITVDNCTPFSWAISLRSFGKSISDTTTSLGYIQWSEDSQTLFYKNLELRVDDFRSFVANQVRQAQNLLAELFLLLPDERREDIIPSLLLHRMRDNPTITENGWLFVLDKRNEALLPEGEGWLLRRVLQLDKLRDRFISLDSRRDVIWNRTAVREYRQRVDAFLESLLLLTHVTSGQPARGTEITSLMHRNTTFHRNIFVEDGLVAVVTSYHKGYSCTGSTKIIHRYLPKEVSELLIYYIWIVLPFVEELDLLVPSSKSKTSSFLWPNGDGCWSTQRLSAILKRETAATFNTPLTISTYRHVAIALSRRHLEGKGFKRDYDIETPSDKQATHTSSTAGRLYARGLEEAAGHIEQRRAEYRTVSRKWHAFLGFVLPSNSPRKRALEEIDSSLMTPKRARLRV